MTLPLRSFCNSISILLLRCNHFETCFLAAATYNKMNIVACSIFSGYLILPRTWIIFRIRFIFEIFLILRGNVTGTNFPHNIIMQIANICYINANNWNGKKSCITLPKSISLLHITARTPRCLTIVASILLWLQARCLEFFLQFPFVTYGPFVTS